jgi:hypothetical protein
VANEPTVPTRETLYQQVWSEPIIHVARRVGLPGRGLGKLCARYSIPVPPRGWWAKKQHGHNVVLCPSDSAPLEVEAPELLRESSPEWRIDVDEELQISHPLVKRAATAIRTSSRDPSKGPAFPWNRRHQAKLSRPGPGCLDVSVSKALVSRALRIMQALLNAFDKRGYKVSVSPENATIVKVLDEPFQIALTERFKQVFVKHRYGEGMELEPSGRLMLRIGSTDSTTGIVDKPPQLIESLLNRFVAQLVRRALDAKRYRAIRAERERRWRYYDDERRQRQQKQDSERLRRRRLRLSAARWGQHQRVSQFVDSVEQRVLAGRVRPEHQELASRWLEWAKTHLAETDPIDAFLDEPWPAAELRAKSAMPSNWE